MWLVCKSNPYKLDEDPRFTSLDLHHFSGNVGLTTQFRKSAFRDVYDYKPVRQNGVGVQWHHFSMLLFIWLR